MAATKFSFAVFFLLLAILALFAPGAAAVQNHLSRPGSLVAGFHEHVTGAAPTLAQST